MWLILPAPNLYTRYGGRDVHVLTGE